MKCLYCLLLLLLLPACDKSGERDAAQKFSLEVPAKFMVYQRRSHEMPGSDGQLLLTIDDITRGQVMTGLAPLQGEAIVETRSLRPGDEVEFTYKGDDYVLLLKTLNNQILGNDSAEFWLKAKGGEFTTGAEKEIRQLLDLLKAQKGAVMIRNGKEHSAEEGAAHLLMKYEHEQKRIQSAEGFIEKLASKSSMSGEDYRIRRQGRHHHDHQGVVHDSARNGAGAIRVVVPNWLVLASGKSVLIRGVLAEALYHATQPTTPSRPSATFAPLRFNSTASPSINPSPAWGWAWSLRCA